MQKLVMTKWVKPTDPNGTAPVEPPTEAAMLDAINAVDTLSDTLRSAVFALAEARLHVPRDRRCRARRPKLAFRPVVERIDRAEGELARVWLTMRKVDFTPLLDRATQP